MIALTGATGQLGRLVITHLLKHIAPDQITALVRSPEKAAALKAAGLVIRPFDYDAPTSLAPALEGIDKLLLISGNEIGKRFPQHMAVIEAAKAAKVKLLAYTSLLNADTSPLMLADEHRATEAAIKTSGIPFVFLRNGWYVENYLGFAHQAIEHGTLIGAAENGKISCATRNDYAEAAAVALLKEDVAGSVFELAGDTAYTLADLAETLARASGKPVTYTFLEEKAYAAALAQIGLPVPLANMLADSDKGAAQGGLFSPSIHLHDLVGRPSETLEQAVRKALGL